MISISVNGIKSQVDAGLTIVSLLEQQDFQPSKVAVAVNTEFAPRSSWAERILSEGDQLDIVIPVQGG